MEDRGMMKVEEKVASVKEKQEWDLDKIVRDQHFACLECGEQVPLARWTRKDLILGATLQCRNGDCAFLYWVQDGKIKYHWMPRDDDIGSIGPY